MRNLNHYTATTTAPMANNTGGIVTCLELLPLIKLLDLFSHGLARSHDKIKLLQSQ